MAVQMRWTHLGASSDTSSPLSLNLVNAFGYSYLQHLENSPQKKKIRMYTLTLRNSSY